MTPNLFLVYVTDIDRSTAFYGDLFEMEPTMRTPRYVPFEIAPGVLFSLWTGRADQVRPELPRTSEVGLMMPGGADAVDAIFERWTSEEAAHRVTVVEPPFDDVFGRTFVITDPDGNLIRVSPVD